MPTWPTAHDFPVHPMQAPESKAPPWGRRGSKSSHWIGWGWGVQRGKADNRSSPRTAPLYVRIGHLATRTPLFERSATFDSQPELRNDVAISAPVFVVPIRMSF